MFNNVPAKLAPIPAHMLLWLEAQGATILTNPGVAVATLNGRTVFFLADCPKVAVLLNGDSLNVLPTGLGDTASVCGYLMIQEPPLHMLADMRRSVERKLTLIEVEKSYYTLALQDIDRLTSL